MPTNSVRPHSFRTAPDGFLTLDDDAPIYRRRTEHMLRPQSNGTVRLALPTELRDDQWDAVVAAQAARLKAYRDRVISDALAPGHHVVDTGQRVETALGTLTIGKITTSPDVYMTPAEAREFRRRFVDPETLRLRPTYDQDGAVVRLSTGRAFRHERDHGRWTLVTDFDSTGGPL